MKRKIVLPALFCLSLLLVLGLSSVPSHAQAETNVWGVSEGDTETYTLTTEFKGTGSGQQEMVVNTKVMVLDDWDSDNITDLELTIELNLDSVTLELDEQTLLGRTDFDHYDLFTWKFGLMSLYTFVVPIAWVEATGSQTEDGGLNWTAAIEAINTAPEISSLTDYNATEDEDTVTVETTEDRTHKWVNGTDDDFGIDADYDIEESLKWNTESGLLEEATWVKTYNESSGLIIEQTLKKGGPGIMDTISDNAIAIGALALALLALLMVLIKR